MRSVSNSLPILTLLASLPWGGCVDSNPVSLANVASVSLSYTSSADAQNPVTNVTINAAGDAICSRTNSSGTRWEGRLRASNSTIPDLLGRPGVLRDLTTRCDPQATDAGPNLVTRLADSDAIHARAVYGACANDGLEQLVAAMEEIGDACIAVATVSSDVPDGGSPDDASPDGAFDLGLPDGSPEAGVDAPPDTALDLGPPDSSRETGPEVAVDGGCVVPLSQFSISCPATYDDVLASRVTCVTYEAINVGECASDHLLMFSRNFGTHVEECFYDPTSRALVAAASRNDIPLCGDSRVQTSSATPFCQPVCGDACAPDEGARFVRVERYRDCCRTWIYPIPGCPNDAGADDAGVGE